MSSLLSAAEEILKFYNIRATDIRIDILKIFLLEQKALGYNELKKKVKKTNDKVTVYRTIYLFLQKGILHKVNDGDRESKYALIMHNNQLTNNINPDHLHFKCLKCHKLICLTNTTVSFNNMPQNFQIKKLSLLAEGICDSCNLK